MKKNLSRRHFLKATALGAAGIVIMPGLSGCKNPSSEKGKSSKSIKRLGFIGLGRQAMFLLSGFIAIPDIQVVAGCDVYGRKRDRFLKKVSDYYRNHEDENLRTLKIDTYTDYNELLKRGDIDAVIISVPDHSHAFVAIDACKAKKDIYLEKPLTFTVKEGQALIKAVRSNGVILAVGSQQRSSEEFQHAVKLVQSGALGKIKEIRSYVGAPPIPYNLPQEEIPSDLDWNAWLGSSFYRLHFNNELNPPISLDPEEDETIWGAWRWYTELGGGFTTDWGAHMFDVAQWALDKDGSGPQKISPIKIDGETFIHYRYFGGKNIPEEGTLLSSERFEEEKKGCKFIGENGWIQVERGIQNFKASNPEWMPNTNVNDSDTPYETKGSHHLNFIEAIRKRIDPVVPVEIGHSSCTVCNIGNIAVELDRELTWDPDKQEFVNDQEANEKLTRPYASGYSID